MTRCAECGASYSIEGDSCEARFDQLLALDHSRQEPWGPRHGQAFAAFALQHPTRFPASLDHAWTTLNRIYAGGVPHRAAHPVAAPTVTIAELGDFDASTYPERLDDWCRAALAMWGSEGDGSGGGDRGGNRGPGRGTLNRAALHRENSRDD